MSNPRFLVGALVMAAFGACAPESCCAAPAPHHGASGAVTDPAVRACDALVTLKGEEVPSVDFGDAVRGESIPQAPRMGLSFTAKKDASLTSESAFTLRFKGDERDAELTKVECFDAAGKRVPGEPLRLQ